MKSKKLLWTGFFAVLALYLYPRIGLIKQLFSSSSTTNVGASIVALFVTGLLFFLYSLWVLWAYHKRPTEKLQLPTGGSHSINWLAGLSKKDVWTRYIWMGVTLVYGLINVVTEGAFITPLLLTLVAYVFVFRRFSILLVTLQMTLTAVACTIGIVVLVSSLFMLAQIDTPNMDSGSILILSLALSKVLFILALSAVWFLLEWRMRKINKKVWTTTFAKHDLRYQRAEADFAAATSGAELTKIFEQHKDSWPKMCHQLLQERFEARKAAIG